MEYKRPKRTKRNHGQMEYERPKSPSLPAELINEILLRLPVKTLLRFRSVLKSWLDLICSPQFIKAHLVNNKDYAHQSLIKTCIGPKTNSMKVCSVRSLLYESVMKASVLDCPLKIHFMIVGSVSGLICLIDEAGGLFLWNPSIRMFKKLTILKDVPRGYTCGFGYDGLHDDYKLACIFSDFRVEIYSLKSKSWRRIDDFNGEKKLYFDMPKLVNGKLHWVTIVRPPGPRSTNGEIVFIDLVDEKWGKLDHPFYEKGEYFLELGVLGSDLCMFCCYDSDFGVVWVMKEYGVKESWAKIYTIKISNSISDVWSPLFSMSNKGDFLVVFRSAFMIYNPKDGSIRSFEVANFNSTFPPFFYVESLVCPFGDEPRT